MKKIFISLFFFGSFLIMKAQSSLNTVSNESNIKGNYTLFTDVGDVEITNKSLQMNLYKTYDFSELRFGINYSSQTRRFKDIQESNMFSSLENSSSIDLYCTYTREHQNNWSTSLSIKPQINTTFKGRFNDDDFILGGRLQISKIWYTTNLERKAEVTFGLHYGTLFGKPLLYPSVSYTHFVSTSWNYTIGFPMSDINYSINEYQNISIKIGPEGNYTNHSGNISIIDSNSFSNSKLEFSSLLIGMDYCLELDNHWTTSFGVSYLPIAELRILDTSGTEIYSFESTESLFINFGVKYKLN